MEDFFLYIGSKNMTMNNQLLTSFINIWNFGLLSFHLYFLKPRKKIKITKWQHLQCQMIFKSTQLTQISNLDAFIILGF